MKLDLKEIVSALRKNDNSCLKIFFLEHGDYCIQNLIKKTNCSPIDADGIFVDAIICLRERLISGKIEYLTNVRAYLYSTCYNMWLVQYRKSKVHASHAEDLKELYATPAVSQSEKEELHNLANKAISSLGDKCQCIIRLFYLSKLNMKEIAEEMGFASAGVAKTLKARCYKKLMEEVKKQMAQNEVYLN